MNYMERLRLSEQKKLSDPYKGKVPKVTKAPFDTFDTPARKEYKSFSANDPHATMTSTGVPWPYPLEYCPTCIHHPGEGRECPKQGRVIEYPVMVTCKHHEPISKGGAA